MFTLFIQYDFSMSMLFNQDSYTNLNWVRLRSSKDKALNDEKTIYYIVPFNNIES